MTQCGAESMAGTQTSSTPLIINTNGFPSISQCEYSQRNGHLALSNSISNSSTNSATSGFSVFSACSASSEIRSAPDNTLNPSNPLNLISHRLHHELACNRQSAILNKQPLLRNAMKIDGHPSGLHSSSFNALCRTHNINNFTKLSEQLHRKIEYTSSGSSASTSGCVSASSSAQLSQLSTSSFGTQSSLAATQLEGSKIHVADSNKIKAIDLSKNVLNNAQIQLGNSNEAKQTCLIDSQKCLEPEKPSKVVVEKKIDTDDEAYLGTNPSNASALAATSTTNLIQTPTANAANNNIGINNNTNTNAAASSYFHYPNIYNPLKNTKNSTKKNKKLIRFMTVCAYVFAVSLVAILLSLYYLFLWNPYTRTAGNLTRTFINSEILFIEKTNYFDVDVSAHPHVIGASPDSPHLTRNVKVNQTEAKVVLPIAVESVHRPVVQMNSAERSERVLSSEEYTAFLNEEIHHFEDNGKDVNPVAKALHKDSLETNGKWNKNQIDNKNEDVSSLIISGESAELPERTDSSTHNELIKMIKRQLNQDKKPNTIKTTQFQMNNQTSPTVTTIRSPQFI